MSTFKERIKNRQEIRANIAEADPREANFLLISESIDDYIEHRIQSDKVLEGILKDIQSNTASMAEDKVEKLLTQSMN